VLFEDGDNHILIRAQHNSTPVLTWNEMPLIDWGSIPRLSVLELQKDLRIAESVIKHLHPGLYRYLSKAQVDSIFKSFSVRIDKPLSYSEAFVVFSELTALLKCGHTFPNFLNQPALIKASVFHQRNKLPFYFKIADHRMIVTASANTVLKAGDEITAIDEKPVNEILRTLMNVMKADGNNDASRITALNTFGLNEIEPF